MHSYDIYDLTILILVLSAAIRGYRKGLVHQLGSLIALGIGFMVSVRFTSSFSGMLPGSENVQSVSAFILLLLVTTLVVWGFVNMITSIINNLKLNSWNYQMGALVGIIQGLILSMILTFLLLVYAKAPTPAPTGESPANQTYTNVTPQERKSFVLQSRFGPTLTVAVINTIDFLPKGSNCQYFNLLRDYLQEKTDEIRKEENIPTLPASPENQSNAAQPTSNEPPQQTPGYPAMPQYYYPPSAPQNAPYPQSYPNGYADPNATEKPSLPSIPTTYQNPY